MRNFNMNIEINYVDKNKYLSVIIKSPWTFENVKRIIDKTKREATRRGLNRILLDLRLWSHPDKELTCFLSGQYLAEELRMPFKIAAYAVPDTFNKFLETVAVNRGALFMIFPDDESAVEWLTNKDKRS